MTTAARVAMTTDNFSGRQAALYHLSTRLDAVLKSSNGNQELPSSMQFILQARFSISSSYKREQVSPKGQLLHFS